MRHVRITKIFCFEAAHALQDYNGPCRNIHGHSYKLHVTIEGDVTALDGILIDFNELKRIVQTTIVSRFDHSLLLKNTDHMVQAGIGKYTYNLVELPYNPSSENLIIHFAELLREALPKNVTLHHLRLYETETSYTEWYAKDNEPLNQPKTKRTKAFFENAI